MEVHVAADHLPSAFRAFIIWFAIRWSHRRRRRRATAATQQQNHKQLQQIHPHFHTRVENHCSIGQRKGAFWYLNGVEGRLILSSFVIKRWPESRTEMRLLPVSCSVQVSLPPPFLGKAFPLLGGIQSDRGALLCLPNDSFIIPFPSWRGVHFLQLF